MPFSGKKRLVVVKRAERLKEEDKRLLAGYIAKPQVTTCLVVDTTDTAFLEGLAPEGNNIETVSFDKIPELKLSGWIKGYFRSHGKSADEDAVEILKELFGQREHGILERELEKLLTFTGDRVNVTAEDVEEIAGKGLFDSTFDLTDSISRQDAPGALKVLRGLFSAGVPRYVDIIGLISWHLRTLLKGRILWEEGCGEFATVSQLRVPKKLRSTFLAQIKRMSVEGLSSKLEMLLGADLDSKTGRMDPKVALEAAVVKLCLDERG